MSTFRGLIKEITGIRVDFFDAPDEDSLYFLSHCHTDHMVGIEGLVTLERAKLVVSAMTKSILGSLYPDLTPLLHVIEIGNEAQFSLASGENILCTALPAGHCPGSVMFYFQSEQTNVLYTGDFRWKASDLKQLKILETVKEDLQAIYVDSTFLLPEFQEFPQQKESVAAVVTVVKEWINASHLNRVFLEIPARFGSEYLLLELYKRLKLDMHLCSVDQGCLLPFIPEMRHFIVPQMNNSVAVVVGMRNTALNPRFHWRTIRPSAMYWSKWKRGDSVVKRDELRKELFRICYSSHSSCSEIMALLELLQPRTIHLNVAPDGRRDRRYSQLKEFTPKIVKEKEADQPQLESPPKYSLLEGFLKQHKPQPALPGFSSRHKDLLTNDDDDEEESPPLVIPLRKKIRVQE